MEKKYYYTYEIKINNPNSSLNNHYYYGKHITSNLKDNYYGSGKIIKIYYKKYKDMGLIKTILNFYNNEEELNKAEKILIEEKKEKLGNLCLNLNEGGHGSFEYINKTLTEEQKHKNAMAGGVANKKRLEDPVEAEKWRQQMIAIHANMSIKDKKCRCSKVSQSLKEYYQTEEGKKEQQQRIEKNRETNKKVAQEWRSEFKILFRGYQPEAFRKYEKQKEANLIFKEIRYADKEIQLKCIEKFFNSIKE